MGGLPLVDGGQHGADGGILAGRHEDLAQGPGGRRFEVHGAELEVLDRLRGARLDPVEALDLDLPQGAVPGAIALKPVPDFAELIELMKVLGPELEAASGASAGRWEERGRFWVGFSEYLKDRTDAAFQVERPPKTGTARFFPIGVHGMLKGKISVAHGTIEVRLRLKGPGSAVLFESLQMQREAIEKAIGAELYWRPKVEGEKYEIGLELEPAGTGEDARAAQFYWLNQMATRFKAVFEPRLS